MVSYLWRVETFHVVCVVFEKMTHPRLLSTNIDFSAFKPSRRSNPRGEGVQVWKTSVQQCVRLTGQALAKPGVLLQYSCDNRAWISRIPKWMNEWVFIGHASAGEELRCQDCLILCKERLQALHRSDVRDTAGPQGDNRYPQNCTSLISQCKRSEQ